MENFKVLRASISDVNEVAKLFDLYRQFYDQKSDIQLSEEFIMNRIFKDESVILLAIDQSEEVVGFCQMYPSFCSVIASPIYVLYDLFTSQNKRNLGIGKALLIAAEKQAKLVGAHRLDLTTAKNNIVAQTLYESLGWKKDEVFFTYNRDVNT